LGRRITEERMKWAREEKEREGGKRRGEKEKRGGELKWGSV